jgi:hypothetical protein
METVETKSIDNVVDNNIVDTMIGLMHIAESFTDFDGAKKKTFVLERVKLVIGDGLYQRYHPLIDLVIDSLVSISRKDIKLYLQKSKTFCLPMFNSCKKDQ